MIQRIPAFKTDDGIAHATVELAIKHDMELACASCTGISEPNTVARFIIENADKIIDILTTTATSKPKARKINGGTKVRKPKPTATPATTPTA